MSRVPRRFLFAMWEGGGTVPPELGVARRAIDAGHEVHVIGDVALADHAQAVGAGFTPWDEAPQRRSSHPDDDPVRDWEASNPVAMLQRARDRFMAGPAGVFARETAAAIESVGPDAVVIDSMMLGPMIAAEGAGLPYLALVPNIWMLPTRGVPAIGPGFPIARSPLGRTRDALMRRITVSLFDRALPAVNEARRAHGLEPLATMFDQVYRADQILVLSSAGFDFASTKVPDHVTYVGPILDEPSWAPEADETPAAAAGRHRGEPVVLVALSSTFQDQVPVLRRIVEAVNGSGARGIVTLGQAVEDGAVEGSEAVTVVRAAPHGQILATAAAVVTHCGHGTTMKALAAGVPMVCIPMGRDQHDTAARVVHHGAGVRLKPQASVADIARALDQVLTEPSYRQAAAHLGSLIRAEMSGSDVVEHLEALAGGRPVPHP